MPFYDILDKLLEECEDSVKSKIGQRCDIVGLDGTYERGKCAEVQNWAADNLELLVNNDRDVYEKGQDARSWPVILTQTREGADYWCETAYKPDAEGEIERLKSKYVYRFNEFTNSFEKTRKLKDQAARISDSLTAPFIRQFLEHPVQERRANYKKCKRAVDGVIADYDSCLRRGVKKSKT